jgi:hypothetical protein
MLMKAGKFCGHFEGGKHDCAYVEWRDTLVPIAEQHADKLCGPEPDDLRDAARWSLRWDATFHREMKRLTLDPFMRATMVLGSIPRSSEVH